LFGLNNYSNFKLDVVRYLHCTVTDKCVSEVQQPFTSNSDRLILRPLNKLMQQKLSRSCI